MLACKKVPARDTVSFPLLILLLDASMKVNALRQVSSLCNVAGTGSQFTKARDPLPSGRFAVARAQKADAPL